MRLRPGVYLAEGTLFATRFTRSNRSFHENSGWLWSSKETKLFVWSCGPLGGQALPCLRAVRRHCFDKHDDAAGAAKIVT